MAGDFPRCLLLLISLFLALAHAQPPMPAPAPTAPVPASPASSPMPSAAGAICPLTGLPPTTPQPPLSRCSFSSSLSCCSACEEAHGAITILGQNGTALLGVLNKIPSLAGLLSTSLSSVVSGLSNQVCNSSMPQACVTLIEDMFCGVACDPFSSSFINKTDGGLTLTVCNAFATLMLQTCLPFNVPGFNQPLYTYITDPLMLVNILAVPILKAIIPQAAVIKAVLGNTTNCFDKPQKQPVSVCCDTLSSVPTSCLNGTVLGLTNRTLPSTCPAPGPGGSPMIGPPPPHLGVGHASDLHIALVFALVVASLVAIFGYGI